MRQCSVNTAHCHQVSFTLRGPQWVTAQRQNGEAPDWLPSGLQRCERPSFRFLRTSSKRPALGPRIVKNVLVHSAMRNAQNNSHSWYNYTRPYIIVSLEEHILWSAVRPGCQNWHRDFTSQLVTLNKMLRLLEVVW